MTAPFRKLELYYFESCPYCQRVLQVIQKLNLKVQFNDIHGDSRHIQTLISITSRKTVPCLFIDGEPKFESSDIMDWMERNHTELEKNN